MILTQDQQAMLDGKFGEGAAYAMKIQVGIGECPAWSPSSGPMWR